MLLLRAPCVACRLLLGTLGASFRRRPVRWSPLPGAALDRTLPGLGLWSPGPRRCVQVVVCGSAGGSRDGHGVDGLRTQPSCGGARAGEPGPVTAGAVLARPPAPPAPPGA